MGLLLTVAVLTLPAYADENEAEKLFRQMENKVNDAHTLQMRFEAALSLTGNAGTIKGKAVLGEGDRIRFDADTVFDGKSSKVVVIGNGTKLFVKDSQQAAIDVKDSPKDLGRYFRTVFPRVGLAAALNQVAKDKETFKVDELFRATDFKLGGKEKIGTAETRLVEYTVVVHGKDKAAGKVWINVQTHLPAKLELRMENMGTALEFSEIYTEFTINGELEGKLFAAPK
jgi:outer membrane lipoprotein-sorting protein